MLTDLPYRSLCGPVIRSISVESISRREVERGSEEVDHSPTFFAERRIERQRLSGDVPRPSMWSQLYRRNVELN